jgi:amino acid transporter
VAFRVGKWGPNVGTFMKIAVVVLFTVLFIAFLIQHEQPHGASTAAGPEAIAERSAAAIGILVFLWVGFELPNGAGQGAENPALSRGSHSGSGGRCVPGGLG